MKTNMQRVDDIDLEQEIAELAAMEAKPNGNGHADIGVENMNQAGTLSINAMREAAKEAAERMRAVGEAIMEEARERKADLDSLADSIERDGEERANHTGDFYKCAGILSSTAAGMRELVRGETKEPQQIARAFGWL